MAKLEPRPALAGQNSKLAMKSRWAHGSLPTFCGELASYPGLTPQSTTTTNLGNNKSLVGTGRQVSWELPSGGAPTFRSFGSQSASPWHIALLAMEECKTKELELPTSTHMFTNLESNGHLVMLLDSFNQDALQDFKLENGLGDQDHVKEACRIACKQTKETQTEERNKQLAA